VLEKVKDPVIKSFWINEFGRYSQRYESEATAAIQNKIGQFISAPLIRNIVGQVNTSFNLRKAMDSKKIILLNLSKGKIGEDASRLLGGLLITKLQLAAMSRVDIPEEKRNDFFLYVDEFQNFATESFVNILSEARKYRLSLILAHQYISQMEEGVRDAVFGNIGTLISFRVGAEDAEYLEKEFSPDITAEDLVNLAKYSIYIKLMVNGLAGRPFSATTLPPFDRPALSFSEDIIRISQDKYSTPRNMVEEQIAEWSGDYVIKESENKKVELYDAKCQMCGREIKVPFKPDGVRPVYCKSCLKKIGGGSKKESASENDSEERPKTVSLEDLLPKEIKKKKKPVSRVGLKQALEEALRGKLKKEKDEENSNNQKSEDDKEKSKEGDEKKDKKGIMKPGDIIKF
jgi:CxxC-x17-CxxC domain-containing protein